MTASCSLPSELVASMLQELDCDVIEARPETVAAIAKDESIGIIIADASIPGASGVELGKPARSMRPDTGVISISGDGIGRSGDFRFLRLSSARDRGFQDSGRQGEW